MLNNNFNFQTGLITTFLLVFSFIANGQDITIKNKPQDLRIKYDGKFFFTMDGKTISYDSCKQRLILFEKSKLELNKVLIFEEKNGTLFTIFEAFVLPAAGFGLADQLTGQKIPWVTATLIGLFIPCAAIFIYIEINTHHQRKHLKRAIELYNEQILTQKNAY